MLQYGIQTVRKKVTMAQTPFFTVFVTYVISSNPSSPAKTSVRDHWGFSFDLQIKIGHNNIINNSI